MKPIFSLIVCCFFVFGAMAQRVPQNDKIAAPEKEKETKKWNTENLYWGGWLNAQFGQVTFVGASPFAAYRFTERFSGGVGATYQYYRDARFSPTFTMNMYGARLFGRFHISEELFLHGEYENLLSRFQDNNGNLLARQWRGAALAGAGYLLRFGNKRNSGFFVMALYNFTYDARNSFYPSPFVLRTGLQI